MPSQIENEAQWITQAQRGNLEAFNALVLAYQDQAYAVAYRIFNDPAAAMDATQDAFIAAYRHIQAYRGGNFRSWLLRIVTNTCYDALRREKRRPHTLIEDLPGAETDDGPALPADTPTPEQQAQTNELRAAIQHCINALQAEQRTVLLLSDVEGFDYQAIADSTGAALGTVKSRLSRARASVRHCLQAVQELLPTEYRLIE